MPPLASTVPAPRRRSPSRGTHNPPLDYSAVPKFRLYWKRKRYRVRRFDADPRQRFGQFGRLEESAIPVQLTRSSLPSPARMGQQFARLAWAGRWCRFWACARPQDGLLSDEGSIRPRRSWKSCRAFTMGRGKPAASNRPQWGWRCGTASLSCVQTTWLTYGLAAAVSINAIPRSA